MFIPVKTESTTILGNPEIEALSLAPFQFYSRRLSHGPLPGTSVFAGASLRFHELNEDTTAYLVFAPQLVVAHCKMSAT